MKLVIAGSRHFDLDREDILSFIHMLDIPIKVHNGEIVSGGCPTGADHAAKDFATRNGFLYKEFPADWDRYGSLAGPKRNGEMAFYGDALLLIWDGSSKGSASMRVRMLALGKPIYEVILKRPL